MDSNVEDIENGIDPEAEVKKLQDLVKKLELQNQILRSKQNREANNTVLAKPGTEDVNLSKQNRTCANDSDIIKDGLKKVTLEDIEFVDVDTLNLKDDEETWLYESPKLPAHQPVSPYKWLREEFEHPSPEVESARRSLIFKLDEVSRVSRSSSAGTLGSLTSPSSATGYLPEEYSPSQPPSFSIGGSPLTRQPGLDSRGINSGTFTRSKKPSPEKKKDPELIDDCNSTPLPVNTNTFTRPKKNSLPKYSSQEPNYDHDIQDAEDSPDNDVIDYHNDVRENDVIDDITSRVGGVPNDVVVEKNGYTHEPKFTDVDSLQIVARMQEESLRQSYSSPLMSPRKSEEYKSKCMSKDSLASTASSHSNSNTSSPPGSPYGSQYLDHKTQVSETHRRSLPNLARTMNLGSLQAFPSEGRLQPRDSPPRGLQKPSPRKPRNPGSGARQASPGRTLSPGRTMSPGRSGIPTPRSSGIPRPGSTSKLPTPRRSGIPSPRRSSYARTDESWKEGCY